MSSNNRINIELGFQADTHQAKAQLKDLSVQLNAIGAQQINTNGLKVTQEQIQQASLAAQQLAVHLKNAVNINTGKLDMTKLVSSLKQGKTSIQQLGAQLQAIGPQGAAAFSAVAQSIATAEIPMIRLNSIFAKFGTTLMNTLRWQLSSSLLSGFVQTVTEAIDYVSELNENLTNIRIVTGYGAEEMEAFAKSANKAAKALSTTTNEYAKASLIYFQQGLNDEEVKKRTDVTIKMANVTRESAETVSEWMTAVWNNFDDGSKSLEHYADVMTALGAATASSSDEIAGGLEKFAAISKTIGLSYEYAASALATVTAVTRQSEDVVGTAFKTIFGRMEGLELGETLEDGVSLNKYSEALSAVGVQILDTNGELKSMDTILNDLGERWGSLAQGQKVALAQVVGGMRQYNQLIALMDNWSYFQENLNVAMSSTGTLSQQAEIYAESWEAARDRVSAAAESIYNTLLDDEAFISMFNFFADFLESIGNVVDSLGGLKGVLLILGSVLLSTFSSNIVAKITDMGTAFLGLTSTGRQYLATMQQGAMNQAIAGVSIYSRTNTEKSPVVKNEKGQVQYKWDDHKQKGVTAGQWEAVKGANSIADEVENKTLTNKVVNQQKINELLANRTPLERELAQLEADTLAKQQEELANKAKNLDAIKQELIALKEKEAILTRAGKKDPEAIDKAGEVVETNLFTYDALKNDPTTGGISQGGYLTQGSALQTNMLEGLNSLEDNALIKSSEELSSRLKKLQRDLTDCKKPADQLEKEYKELNAEILRLSKSGLEGNLEEQADLTNKLEKETKELQDEQSKLDQQNKKFQKGLENKSIPKYSESLATLGSGITTMASGLMFLTSAWGQVKSAMEDGKLSFDEVLGIVVSLGMAIPMVLSGFGSFGKAIQGIAQRMALKTAASQQDAIATAASTTAEATQTSVEATSIPVTEAATAAQNKENIADAQSVPAKGASTAGTVQQTVANVGLLATMWPLLAVTLALVAAFVLIAVAIGAAAKAANAHNIAAENAAKASENAAKMAEEATDAYNGLKESVSKWKTARENIDNLTKGTEEFKNAVLEANEQAMGLINTYNLGADAWHFENGIIEIDQEALEKKQSEYYENMVQLKSLTALMANSSRLISHNATELNYLKDNISGTTKYVEYTTNSSHVSSRDTSKEEEQIFLNALQNEYSRLIKQGELEKAEKLLKDNDTMETFLNAQMDKYQLSHYSTTPVDMYTGLTESFIEHAGVIRDLIKQEHRLEEAVKKETAMAIYNSNKSEFEAYGLNDIQSEIISSLKEEQSDITKLLSEGVRYDRSGEHITIGNRSWKQTQELMRNLTGDENFATDWTDFGEFEKAYLKAMFGDDAGNYKMTDGHGEYVTIQVKDEATGAWKNLGDMEDESWSKEELAKQYLYTSLLGVSGKQTEEYIQSLNEVVDSLDKIGITLNENNKDLIKAILSNEDSIESYGSLTKQEQNDLNEELNSTNANSYQWDSVFQDLQTKNTQFAAKVKENGTTTEEFKKAIENLAQENNIDIVDAYKEYLSVVGLDSSGVNIEDYHKLNKAKENEVVEIKKLTEGKSQTEIDQMLNLLGYKSGYVTTEDINNLTTDNLSNFGVTGNLFNLITELTNKTNLAGGTESSLAAQSFQNFMNTFSTEKDKTTALDVVSKFTDWSSPWWQELLIAAFEEQGLYLDENIQYLEEYSEILQKNGLNGQSAAKQLDNLNNKLGSLKEMAKLALGDVIDPEKLKEYKKLGLDIKQFTATNSEGKEVVIDEYGLLAELSKLKPAAKLATTERLSGLSAGQQLYNQLNDGNSEQYGFETLRGKFNINTNSDGSKDFTNFEQFAEDNQELVDQALKSLGVAGMEGWKTASEEKKEEIISQFETLLQDANNGGWEEVLKSYIIEQVSSEDELKEFIQQLKDQGLYDSDKLDEIEEKTSAFIRKQEKEVFVSKKDEIDNTKKYVERLKLLKKTVKTEEERNKYNDAIVSATEKTQKLTEEYIQSLKNDLNKELENANVFYKDYYEILADGSIAAKDNYKELMKQKGIAPYLVDQFTEWLKKVQQLSGEISSVTDDMAQLQNDFKEFAEEQKIRNQERIIERLERQIDSLSKTKDRAWGKERVKLMEQEIGLQNKMAAEQLKLKNLYEQQAAAARSELAAYSEYVSFDKNGLLKFNTGASGIGSSEQLEELQDLVDKYDEALEGMWDAQDAAIEASMESYDLRLEQLPYIIEMQILGNQENIALLERALEKLEDKMFSAAERLNNLIAQAVEYGKQIDAYDPDKILSGFGVTKDATNTESWVALFQKYTQANRSGTIEQLEESRDALAELETQIYDLSKSVADVLLEAFEEFGESFDKLEERSSTLSSIVDSYNNIVNLTRQFTEVDASMVQSLIDANATLSKTSMNTAKTEYETLLANQKLIQERYNSSKISDSSLASYWKQQLDEINSLVESARADFMTAWEEALQAAAEAFKASVENIVSTFEKSMTGAFGTYASMQKAYEQQSKVMNRYLAAYERTYELTKLTRKLDKDLDETDNLKARETLKDLQDEINELQRAEVEMSKNDLTFLQKKYDLRLAEIALEEAQKAKNSVTLQRNAEGGWGYVYTADQNNIAEAQQKYEDTFQQAYKSQMDNIKSLEGSLLGNIQTYLNEIKKNEGDQEALERVQNTYNELLAADAAEIDRAINNINELVNETDLEGYESINFANTLLGEVLGEYETAGLWSEEFLQKLTEQVLIPTTEQITEQEKIMNDLLEFGADGSFGENLKAFEDEIIKANEQLNKDIEERGETTELADAINTAFSKDMEIVFDYYSKVEGALEKIRQALEAARWAAENTPTYTPSYSYGGGGGRTYQTVELFTTTTVKNKNKIKETPWSEVKVNANDLTVVHSTSSGGKIYEDSKGNRYSTYKTPDLYKSFETLDTGGYTGAWGTEGRLALLHQKEIVLNATDTENFLSAIGIMRSIVDIINLQATANAFNNSKLKAANIPSSGSLEQQVTIHAEFPNVTNHYEIEEALNNIVNSASQYANRKI